MDDPPATDRRWWKEAVVYQVYPRSFNDSDGDSIAEALDRMEALIEDLLTLARQGDAVENPETVGLEAVATAAWATTETEAAELRT